MKKLMKSFRYAIKGFRVAITEQSNLQFHIVAAIIVIITALVFHVSFTEWCILLLCIGLVITSELINTSIEELVNLVSPEWKNQAAKVKDIAASAVLWVSIISAVIGFIIFSNHITFI